MFVFCDLFICGCLLVSLLRLGFVCLVCLFVLELVVWLVVGFGLILGVVF